VTVFKSYLVSKKGLELQV